ncbi:MAG: hypothetical protein U9P00_03465 [Pseudomonadota bacterium]|nr:hypothetical protein [Pseudomonadota bacterium]
MCLETWLSAALKMAAKQPHPKRRVTAYKFFHCVARSGEAILPGQKAASMEGGPDRERAILQQMAAGSNY